MPTIVLNIDVQHKPDCQARYDTLSKIAEVEVQSLLYSSSNIHIVLGVFPPVRTPIYRYLNPFRYSKPLYFSTCQRQKNIYDQAEQLRPESPPRKDTMVPPDFESTESRWRDSVSSAFGRFGITFATFAKMSTMPRTQQGPSVHRSTGRSTGGPTTSKRAAGMVEG